MFPTDTSSASDDTSSWILPGFSESNLPDSGSVWDEMDVRMQCDSDSLSSSDGALPRNELPPAKPLNQKAKQRTLAPNLTRRSHKKSRAGCFTCKRRKIKCGEEQPTCRNCVQKDLECLYPDHNLLVTRSITKRPPAPQQALSTTSGLFTLTDFRFFQHFLKFAYPTLPAGNDRVWVSDIPQLALENEYLMHAALSLGASHLHRLMPQKGYDTPAILHRGHAISGLNQAIVKRHITKDDADAMLATCYALTFQASYMDDGLQDFITMVRGCALVANKIREESSGTSFDLSENVHFEALEPAISQISPLDADFIDSGLIALDGLKHLVLTDPEAQFRNAMVDVLLALRQSTRQGYIVFSKTYACWYLLSGETFRTFTDPRNAIAQLLLAYFVPLQLMIAPATVSLHYNPLRQGHPGAEMLLGIVAWAERAFANVPDKLQVHLTWPRMIISTIRLEIDDPKGESKILRLPNRP